MKRILFALTLITGSLCHAGVVDKIKTVIDPCHMCKEGKIQNTHDEKDKSSLAFCKAHCMDEKSQANVKHLEETSQTPTAPVEATPHA